MKTWSFLTLFWYCWKVFKNLCAMNDFSFLLLFYFNSSMNHRIYIHFRPFSWNTRHDIFCNKLLLLWIINLKCYTYQLNLLVSWNISSARTFSYVKFYIMNIFIISVNSKNGFFKCIINISIYLHYFKI